MWLMVEPYLWSCTFHFLREEFSIIDSGTTVHLHTNHHPKTSFLRLSEWNLDQKEDPTISRSVRLLNVTYGGSLSMILHFLFIERRVVKKKLHLLTCRSLRIYTCRRVNRSGLRTHFFFQFLINNSIDIDEVSMSATRPKHKYDQTRDHEYIKWERAGGCLQLNDKTWPLQDLLQLFPISARVQESHVGWPFHIELQ